MSGAVNPMHTPPVGERPRFAALTAPPGPAHQFAGNRFREGTFDLGRETIEGVGRDDGDATDDLAGGSVGLLANDFTTHNA